LNAALIQEKLLGGLVKQVKPRAVAEYSISYSLLSFDPRVYAAI